MKKVLLVVGSLNVGGLQKVAMEIVRCCNPQEFSFDFLVYGSEKYDYEEEAINLGCKLIRIPKPGNRYLRYYHNLQVVMEENGPYDIVHSHVYFNSSLVVSAAKSVDVPMTIGHSHSIKRENDNRITKKIVYVFMRSLLNRYSDKFVACSKDAGNYVFGVRGFTEKGYVIYNPVKLDEFSYSEKNRIKIRKELGIALDQYVIGSVSRLVKGKNPKFLIDVFNTFQKETDSALLIVGEGTLRGELENYSKELGIYEKVYFTGQRADVPALLSAMDIFALPSKHEGMGIVLIEAMANGLSCIYENNAIVEEVKQISYGYSIEGFDAQKWKQKINGLLNNKRVESIVIEKELHKFGLANFQKQLKILYECNKEG